MSETAVTLLMCDLDTTKKRRMLGFSGRSPELSHAFATCHKRTDGSYCAKNNNLLNMTLIIISSLIDLGKTCHEENCSFQPQRGSRENHPNR